jgi:predicted aspartyl protease
MTPALAAAILLALVGPIGLRPNESIPRTAVLEAVSERAPKDEADDAQQLKFRTDPNLRMTVPVRLSDRGPFRFLVDTGSDRTAISRDVAARLNLPVGPIARLHSVTGVSDVETTTVPRLQFGSKVMSRVEAPLLEAENIGADGILGVDSLGSQRVLFDFKAGTMAIVSARESHSHEPGTIVVRGRLKNGRLVLTRARADDRPVTVVLDTGSQLSIGNEQLRRRLEKSGKIRNSGKVELQSVTGEILVGDYAFIETLEVGGIGLRNLAVVFADAHTFRKLGLEDRPALLLGMNAMRAFEKVTIDFANKKLRVLMPDQSSLDQALMAARASRVSAALMPSQ